MTNANGTRCTITGVTKQRSLTRIRDAFESTFQRDYVYCPIERQPPVMKLPPANVIPKHACYSQAQESTSKETFKSPHLEHSKGPAIDSHSCFQSHFKMETDRVRETGSSTQRDSYQVMMEDPNSSRHQFQTKTHLSETTGQYGNLLGTLDNQKDMSSEYSGIYCSQRPFVAKTHRYTTAKRSRGNMTARHTVTGTPMGDLSGRDMLFPLSSHRRDYQYHPLPMWVGPQSPTHHLNTPQVLIRGDCEKFPIPATNNQLSYKAPPPPSGPSYQRMQAFAKTHQSNFHPGDPRINSFGKAVTSPQGIPLNCFPPAGHPPVISADMNVSHFPQGDLDPGRITARMNYSSTQHSHKTPPPGFFPKHIQGAYTRAESHFQIGCPSNHLPPQSTMMSTYHAPFKPQHFVCPPPPDNIHFTYRGPDQYMSTTINAHRPFPKASRERLNPAMINKLKQSHWCSPQYGNAYMNQGIYRTSHQSSFQHHRPPREVDVF